MFNTYRVFRFGESKPTTQGTFESPEAVMNYLKKRGLDGEGAYRIEREYNGKWIFITNKTL